MTNRIHISDFDGNITTIDNTSKELTVSYRITPQNMMLYSPTMMSKIIENYFDEQTAIILEDHPDYEIQHREMLTNPVTEFDEQVFTLRLRIGIILH